MISYLVGLIAAAATSTAAFVLVLNYFDPNTTGDVGLGLFLATLLFTIVSVGSLLGYYFGYRRGTADTDTLWTALRLSGMIGAVTTGFVALQILHLFHWWYLPVAILVIVMVEIYLKVKVE